jgi:two-component system KDP operon response regulator KdpE
MSARKPVIIIIEDNPSIRRVLRTELASHGFEVHEADTGHSGMTAVENRKADLVILDLGLSDIGGLVVLKRLRAWTTMPVIVISAPIAEEDKIAALDAGADDCITKPFGLGELMARIRVALRRANLPAQQDAEGVFSISDLRVDLARRRVHVAGRETHLSRRLRSRDLRRMFEIESPGSRRLRESVGAVLTLFRKSKGRRDVSTACR